MVYIFLEESGDLGFDLSKKKTSKFFLITFLIVHNKKPIDKIIQKIFASFTKKEIRFHHGVLHSHKELPKIRSKILRQLSAIDNVFIVSIYLDKRKVYTKMENEKHVLYNYIANILLDRVYKRKLISPFEQILLIASRRETNKFLNENFRKFLSNQVTAKHKVKIEVKILPPHEEKSLQVVDFVSWAIYRKLEYSDNTYYNLIKSKIVEEDAIFS